MTHVGGHASKRGAKLIVIDPYRTATAEVADFHLLLCPGTDGALACGVMHVLFSDGFADRDYLARYTDVAGELEAISKAATPQWAARITGLPAANHRFRPTLRHYDAQFMRVGFGFSRSRNGSAHLLRSACRAHRRLAVSRRRRILWHSELYRSTPR